MGDKKHYKPKRCQVPTKGQRRKKKIAKIIKGTLRQDYLA